MRRYLIIIFLLSFISVFATEYQPWLGNIYEFEIQPSLTYQHFSKLSSGSHSIKYRSDDIFLNGSVRNSFDSFGVELEAKFGWTKFQKGSFDQIKLTGRYVIADDLLGDSYGIVTGLSLGQASQKSVHDISSFHHGLHEAELFLSIGKEFPFETSWDRRWWTVLGIGTAVEKGSPWIRFHFVFEKSLCENQELRFFVHSLWGLGKKQLFPCHFHGYGPICHQSIDLGLRYTYLLEYLGNASVEYSYRVHARNFPMQTHQVLAQFIYFYNF